MTATRPVFLDGWDSRALRSFWPAIEPRGIERGFCFTTPPRLSSAAINYCVRLRPKQERFLAAGKIIQAAKLLVAGKSLKARFTRPQAANPPKTDDEILAQLLHFEASTHYLGNPCSTHRWWMGSVHPFSLMLPVARARLVCNCTKAAEYGALWFS